MVDARMFTWQCTSTFWCCRRRKAADTAVPLLELVAEEDSVPAVRAAAAAALTKIRGG